jgi:hypothetical protein
VSAEPARRPEDEVEVPTPEVPQPQGDPNQGDPNDADGPSAEEALPAAASDPADSPTDALTPEAAADAEAAAAAAAEAGSATADDDAVASEVAVVTADAAAAETTAEAIATIDAASDEATAQAKAAEEAAADKKARGAARRRSAGGALKTVATIVIGAVLLVAGIAIGNYVFLTTRPAPIALGDPGTNLQNPAPAAQEFIGALAVNDEDAVRSSLDADPHNDLTREMTKYGIQRVDSIEVLGTSVDGPRSATEILMHYQREDGISFAINLVILVNDGKIEGFR